MSRSDRRRSVSPRRDSRRYHSSGRRSRSPRKRDRDYSPSRRRASPEYTTYKQDNRRPQWMETDMSDDDVREQAGADPMEYRRLKRLKLNERGIRGFWTNTPTPSPSPERKPRSKPEHAANGEPSTGPAFPILGDDADKVAEEEGKLQSTANSLQAEILKDGPEAAELHEKAARLFQDWLADERLRAAEAEKRRKQEEADNVMVGPVLETGEKQAADYGTHMRPGEGTAMAAYVQSGKRIPRRGEVGMSANQISTYEDLGYVMSGSRHNRMNAIRIRKENQVYTAEEKAALAMFNAEENKRKEEKILADMQRLVQQTLGEPDDTGGEAE